MNGIDRGPVDRLDRGQVRGIPEVPVQSGFSSGRRVERAGYRIQERLGTSAPKDDGSGGPRSNVGRDNGNTKRKRLADRDRVTVCECRPEKNGSSSDHRRRVSAYEEPEIFADVRAQALERGNEKGPFRCAVRILCKKQSEPDAVSPISEVMYEAADRVKSVDILATSERRKDSVNECGEERGLGGTRKPRGDLGGNVSNLGWTWWEVGRNHVQSTREHVVAYLRRDMIADGDHSTCRSDRHPQEHVGSLASSKKAAWFPVQREYGRNAASAKSDRGHS